MRRLGIYGGGQLGAYLCQAGRNLGLECTVLAASKAATAASYADQVVLAQPNVADATAELIDRSDVVTFEMEDVPRAALRKLGRAAALGQVNVAPGIAALALLQNKLSQKHWLVSHGFPTAEFVDCPHGVTAADISNQIGLPFVQKAHRGGYDGKGVQLVERLDDEALWVGAAFAERFVAQKRELSVLVARSVSGDIAVYPVVEMTFEPCGHVLCDALAPAAVTAEIAKRAQHLATEVVAKLDGVGLYAVEMFLTDDHGLLINEVAPRVHNSGHLTLEAHLTSQYEQHLRAIFDLPLGSTAQRRPAAMVNLLNADRDTSYAEPTPSVTAVGRHSRIYWYGKQGGAPLRKMGHVTSLAEDLDTALSIARSVSTGIASHRGLVA